MRAAEVKGEHAGWTGYLNGPTDYEVLLGIRGIGPARASLLLRVYGSIDAFLQAEPADVAIRTRSAIGPRRAARLQASCREAGLTSDWKRLEELTGGATNHGRASARLRAALEPMARRWIAGVRRGYATRRAELRKLGRAMADGISNMADANPRV